VDWKRVDLLLTAVAELLPSYDDLELLVIGDGPQRTAWNKWREQLGIADRVRFVGAVYDVRELANT